MGRKGMVAGYPVVLEHETGTLSLNASWYLDSFTGDFPSELFLWLSLAISFIIILYLSNVNHGTEGGSYC